MQNVILDMSSYCLLISYAPYIGTFRIERFAVAVRPDKSFHYTYVYVKETQVSYTLRNLAQSGSIISHPHSTVE
jgi:hypothetical protein